MNRTERVQNTQCNKTPNATKRPMQQNAQCNKTPNGTKRSMQQNALCNKTPYATKRPMQQNAQCNKSPKIKYHSINVGLLKITSAVPSTTLYFSKSGTFGLKRYQKEFLRILSIK